MKEYRYDSRTYGVHVTLTNGFMALVCVGATLFAVANPMPWRALLLAAIVVAGYAAWNAFVSLSNPSKITVSDKEITFAAYGREHRYRYTELTAFRVREMGGNDKMFVRVNDAGILRGRYWVDVFYFNDSKELGQALLKLERKLHPDSLKEVARSGKPLNPKKK